MNTSTSNKTIYAGVAIVVLLVAISTVYITHKDTSAVPATQVVTATSTEKKVPSREFARKEETDAYTIDIFYPHIEGTSAGVSEANASIKKALDEEIATFISDAKQAKEDMKDNQAFADEKSYFSYAFNVEASSSDYISLVAGEEVYGLGAAHPQHFIETFTFDYKAGKLITLADLFKADSKYLSFLSTYARKDLRTQFKEGADGEDVDTSMIDDGTKPEVSNFKNFALSDEGLVIYFNEYQVAPYVSGPQRVVIPYNLLAPYVNPESLLASLINQ